MAWIDSLAGGDSASEQVWGVFGNSEGSSDAADASFAGWMAGDGGSGGRGQWTFDKEQINNLIGKWTQLEQDCQSDFEILRSLAGRRPEPSPDDPSGKFASAVKDGVEAMLQSNNAMRAYIADFISKLEDARSKIERQDDDNRMDADV